MCGKMEEKKKRIFLKKEVTLFLSVSNSILLFFGAGGKFRRFEKETKCYLSSLSNFYHLIVVKAKNIDVESTKSCNAFILPRKITNILQSILVAKFC